MKAMARQLEIERERPIGTRVAITAHDTNLWAEDFQRFENRWLADVAEVPNLIGFGNRGGYGGGQAVVGIRNDGDAPGFPILKGRISDGDRHP